LHEARRLPPQLDRIRIDRIQPRAMQPNIITDLPRQQRMLLGRIISISRTAGAANTSDMLAVAFALPRSAAAKAGKSAVR